jgi:hypothetical protein
MSTGDTTISQLEAVREAAAEPQAAYLIRSRLRRALLSCARTVAELQGVEKPVLPGQWVATSASPEATEVIGLCRRIHQSAEHLCQPSESFDIRWEDGWRDLETDLNFLKLALARLGDGRST